MKKTVVRPSHVVMASPDWPMGAAKFMVNELIRAGRNPNLSPQNAATIVNTLDAYLQSLPVDQRGPTAWRLVQMLSTGVPEGVNPAPAPEVVRASAPDSAPEVRGKPEPGLFDLGSTTPVVKSRSPFSGARRRSKGGTRR